MTKSGASSGEGIVSPAATRQTLKAKSEISKLLFGSWQKFGNQDAEAVRMLSYKPRRKADDPVHSGDMLTEQFSSNADIFTSGRWAAKRAHEVFLATISNLHLFAALRREPRAPDMDDLLADDGAGADSEPRVEFDAFEIVVVGSSVAGLTFHGTLIYLFREWQAKTDAPYGLNDLFTFRFLDSHHRPLQRLRQARDRRIIPRFEFERLLNVDVQDFPAALWRRQLEGEEGEATENAAFYDAWNEHDTLGPSNWAAIESNQSTFGLRYMPKELCWEAGGVREVANQILDGYKAIAKVNPLDWTFDSLKKISPAVSTTGGQLYRTAACLPDDENNNTLVGLWTAENFDATSPSVRCDFVLLATGPGIDISPTVVTNEETEPRRLHQNTQSSYWNTPKIELDLVEADVHNVLVLGHSDSAAGSIYSNLLNDPEACSYRFLTQLIEGNSDYADWFIVLKNTVRAYRDANPLPNESTTACWQRALKDVSVLNVLFGSPAEANYAETTPQTGHSGQTIKDLLRSHVAISLAFHAKDGRRVNYQNLPDEPPIFIDCADAGEIWHKSPLLRAGLFDRAWPENRIVMALLSPQIKVFQENGVDHENLIRSQELGIAKSTGTVGETETDQFLFSVPLYCVDVSYKVDKDTPLNEVEVTFKYVLDCRGEQFSSKYGNFHCYVVANDPPNLQDDSELSTGTG